MRKGKQKRGEQLQPFNSEKLRRGGKRKGPENTTHWGKAQRRTRTWTSMRVRNWEEMYKQAESETRKKLPKPNKTDKKNKKKDLIDVKGGERTA